MSKDRTVQAVSLPHPAHLNQPYIQSSEVPIPSPTEIPITDMKMKLINIDFTHNRFTDHFR